MFVTISDFTTDFDSKRITIHNIFFHTASVPITMSLMIGTKHVWIQAISLET